ncbi:Gfo/Idh/MocA family protein [Alicyclobacillus shizuokensis]|uniref:Gfo/Idh/MocA family protein n=1 Tax=Alicyclobacillus shizuokensis TaxID=392014 RepID=UPI00082C5C8A|nr:Gfo/Idh/MocA family oxidoreductase [Alicyclobacillus shizuokensis]MCL6625265.1 Gfo/Idh/MocA family oxidoreductase [Alicyclobacillus shizuokensis]
MKVIVIGAGTMGATHARAYAQMVDVELTGVVDIRPDAAKLLADEVGVRAYADLHEALANVEADIVDICVPTPYHKELIVRAAELGKHIISEKPLCTNLTDAHECVDVCREAGVRLFVGQVVRFFPEYQTIHRLIQDGAVGAVGTARAYRGGSYPRGWNDWYANPDASGSVLVDLMIHDFDFFRWCFGEVKRVYAKTIRHTEGVLMEHAFASLRFETGVIAHVEGTWAVPSGFSTEIEVAGASGLLTHRSEQSAAIRISLRETTHDSPAVAVPESPLARTPYHTELAHFIECIRENKEPIVRPEDAIKALEISLAAVESAQTGQVVTLN